MAVLGVCDAAVLVAAGLLAQVARFGEANATLAGAARLDVSYRVIAAILAPLWVGALAISGAYGEKVVGAGADEYRRIVEAGLRFVAAIAIVSFLFRLDVSRGFLAAVGPLALAATFLAHWGARRWLHRRRARGDCVERAIVVGSAQHVEELVRHLARAPYVGLSVVGACTGGPEDEVAVDDTVVPVVATPEDLVERIGACGADAVIVADAAVLGLGAIRRFAWALEGRGVDLIVAPTITGVAGPRIAVRPVAGLPLLHVEEPRLSGGARVAKGIVERTAAAVLLLVLSPLLLVIALVVRLTSSGPALYRQVRIGKGGAPFTMLKFRTMVEGAEDGRTALDHLNEHDGPLFKMRRDPRITRVGRWLRRFSLDELPQLGHVVAGRMSVVGPRPPLPEELEAYDDVAWRRLLVRPGLTGLWQVSGRCELPWLETLRLDLYYVENWSLTLDLVILAKTVLAVLSGRGAY